MEEVDYVPIKRRKKCCVSGCSNKSSKRHRFPIREPELFQAWIERVKPPHHNDLSMQDIYNKYVVCGEHFSQEWKVLGTRRGLNRRAIPSLNIPKFDAESSLETNDVQIPVPSTNYTSHPEVTEFKKIVIGHGVNRRSSLGEVNETQVANLSPRATDTRYFSKEFMTEFIRVYRQHPSLWKIKSKEYKSRNLKNVGITKLIEVCKQFHVMEADKEFVLKKIQSIRGSFRKENKKLKDSQRHAESVGDIYVPTLWYFDLLKFTLDQEIATESISNFDSTSSDISESSEESQDQSYILQVVEGNNSQSEEEEDKLFQLPTKHPKKCNTTNKKCNTTNNESTIMFMKACTDALSTKNRINEEFRAVGMNVSAKLQKMEPTQQAYSEFLIQKVLTLGALGKLTENTDLVNTVNSHFIYSPNPHSSISSGIHHGDDD